MSLEERAMAAVSAQPSQVQLKSQLGPTELPAYIDKVPRLCP